MADDAMASDVESLVMGSADVTAAMKKNWGWFLTAGIIMVVIGVIALAVPAAATVVVELFLGWVFLIGGIFEIISACTSWSSGSSVIRLLSGILSVIVGIILLTFVAQGVLVITLLLGIYFIVQGVVSLIWAFQARPLPNWGWVLFNGIVSLILGGLIWGEWPGDAAWVIGLLVGIGLIFGGWTRIMLAVAFRGLDEGVAAEEPAAPEPTPADEAAANPVEESDGPENQAEPTIREE